MACNCKKRNEIEERYGVKEEESFIGKIYRQLWKVIFFVITIMLAIVITPIMILVIIYKIFFGKGKPIMLPKQLSKYLK